MLAFRDVLDSPHHSPRTPVVLAQGLLGVIVGLGEIRFGPLRAGYFWKIDRAIAARGHPVITPLVHPTGGIPTRAAQLKQQILRHLDDLEHRGRLPMDGKCVVLAHSMGGLDARYMLSRLGMDDRVRAVVTISTPHRGSAFADWTIKHIDRRIGLTSQLARFGLDFQACLDLTRDASCGFNEATPNAAGVRYVSVSAGQTLREMSPLLRFSGKLIEAAEGLNDGLVSVASATWGDHWETWPADHLHTINRQLVLKLSRARDREITPRYLALLDRLASHGLLEPASKTR